MEILKNYDFLEVLVKGGEVKNSLPFARDGVCYVDDINNPKCAYVFHHYKDCIWWTYAYIKHTNKLFYKFHKEVLAEIKKLNLPILGTHLGHVFKNHCFKIGVSKDSNIYLFVG